VTTSPYGGARQKSRVETSPAQTSFGSRPGLQVFSLTSASSVASIGQLWYQACAASEATKLTRLEGIVSAMRRSGRSKT